jgi:hypothetical protein
MKKIKLPASKLDERPIGTAVVTYVRQGDEWFIEVAAYTGQQDTPASKQWPIKRGVIDAAQLQDLTFYCAAVLSNAVQAMLPVQGVIAGT